MSAGRRGPIAALAAGALALVAGTAMGWNSSLVEAVVTPAPILRALLVAIAVLFSAWAFRRGVLGIARGRDAGAGGPAVLVRGVRFLFLGLAGLAAAAGWLLGHPLPLVIALVIGAVDVLETTFLLLVMGVRGAADPDRTGDLAAIVPPD